MKKNLLLFVSFLFVAVTFSHAQPTISCPAVSAGNDTTIANSVNGCVLLTAVPVSGFQPTTYNVAQIPYNPYPFTVGAPIIINQDDVYGPVTTLPFDFCFYGNNYNQCQPSSNGYLSFDLFPVGSGSPWAIGGPIPDPFAPLNCIMGPWHDINPAFGGAVYAQMYGTAPCRVFVVSWNQNAMFSCTSITTTQQIAIYETTNIIEVYIQDKPQCNTWNNGAAILGVHNSNGTQAVVAPGRNFPNQWAAVNEGWRWTPAGNANYSIQWFQVGNPVAIATTDTVTVCPPACNTQYYAVATYTNCNNTQVTVSDTLEVQAANPNAHTNPTITEPLCFNGTNGSVSLNPSGGINPYTYQWSGFPGTVTGTLSNIGAGTYHVQVTDSVGCLILDSFVVTQPTQLLSAATNTNALCFGSATGTATTVANGGTPNYTYNWSPSGGTGATASGLAAGQYIVTVTDNHGCTTADTVQVTQPTAVTANLSMVPPLCNGSSTGQATVVPGGGTPGYTYNWSPSNQTGVTAFGLAAGNHSVTVTDNNGCTATQSIAVTQPTALASTISHVDVTCNGGSNGTATVFPSGGTPNYTYAWSGNPSTSATASGLSAGNYTCTITDSHGCQITRAVQILEPQPAVVVVYSSPEICVGFCNGTASVVPSGGTPPYNVIWSNGGTTNQIINLCAGTYGVTLTDAQGCVASGSTVVTANPSPSANAGPDMSFCEGSGGVTLTGSASGGGGAPYYYTWSCNTPPCGLSCISCPNPVANPTDTTTYYMVVTDGNGCASPMDSLVVYVLPKPIVDAGADTSICGTPAPCVVLTPTITHSPGPFTYQWLPSTGLNNANIMNPCARPNSTTIYALVVTSLSTGCSSDYTTTDTLSTVTVTVSPLPIADAGPDKIICEGDSALLFSTGTNAGPVYEYQWSPINGLSNYASPSPWASPSQTTQYSLVVWSNGCPSNADNITVFVTEIPTVNAGADRDICAGDSAFLDGYASVASQIIADSILTYTWSPSAGLNASNDQDAMASPTQTGYYYLTAGTVHGCTNVDSVLVTINPSPLLDAGPSMTVCGGTGPWNLNGTINWVNNQQPGDQQNVLIDWQAAQNVVGPHNLEDVQIETDSTQYFYFTVTYNTCTATDSVLVTVLNQVLATAEADTNVICSGDSVLLMAAGGLGGASFNWFPSGSLENASADTTMAGPTDTTTYYLTVNESGCLGYDTVTVIVIPSPVATYVSSFSEGCAPVEVIFSSYSSNGVLLTWDYGDGSPRVNGDNPTHIYANPGSYPVSLWAVNQGGCADSAIATTTVVVHDTVAAEFHSDPTWPVQLVLPGSMVNFFDDTPGAVLWSWDFGTGMTSSAENPTYTFSEPGTYYVTMMVRNEFDCPGTVTHGPYIVLPPDLLIPNVFSPNGDGVNDRFMVNYTGSQPVNVSVFDRWGVQMYQSNNKNEGWDGNNADGQAVVDGVYFYVVTIANREFAASVTLVR
jgi:gliding motility-associated-like protein